MTHRLNILRAALATAVLATGVTATAGSTSCDPMYPCYADGTTPATVYDLAARTQDRTAGRPAPTAEGLEADLFLAQAVARSPASPAAVYDPAVRIDHSPCQSYPCYPENAPSADAPIAADATATARAADQRG